MTESANADPGQHEAAGGIDDLLHAFEARASASSAMSAATYCSLGRQALELGHPSLAFDSLKEGLSLFPAHPEMTYRAALALARSGSSRASGQLLEGLIGRLSESDPLFTDALSLAGRLAKDRFFKLRKEPERRAAARQSAASYAHAFALTRDFFPGINAATMSMVAGNSANGVELATRVHALCLDRMQRAAPDDYWLPATLGEACLLLARGAEAADWYARAAERAKERFGDIASMRRQVRMLSGFMEVPVEVWTALAMPRVIAFCGHMIDPPGRAEPRFSPGMEAAVRKEIDAALARLDARFGYSSAACGGDVLFMEAMLARGAEVHVVLPFKRADFVETSVAFAGAGWVERFDRALARATSLSYATEEAYLGDEILFAYTNDLIQGMTVLRAAQLEADPVLVAVLDPAAAREAGGTAESTAHWRARGLATELLDLARIRSEQQPSAARTPAPPPSIRTTGAVAGKPRIARQIQTMLFTDVVGFSKLGEEAAPSFFVEFLGEIAKLIEASTPKPASCNTWGDGLFIVFDDVGSGADFALRLRDMIAERDWREIGLPAETSIRIAMHSGPVYRAFDPIIVRPNYFGSHVNRAARIEPVTTPGSVFLSEQAACLLSDQGRGDFACDYLGVVELAKKFGSGVLYRLRRADETE